MSAHEPHAAPVADRYRPGVVHGPAGPSRYDTERGGWVRECLCGSLFISYENWAHVPRLFDHIAAGGQTLGIA